MLSEIYGTFGRRVAHVWKLRLIFLTAVPGLMLVPVAAHAETLRIVNWNIDADNTAPDKTYNGIGYGGSTNGIPYGSSQLETVLDGIGANSPVNSTNTFDVLALTELYKTPSLTLNSIVTNLNAKYGAGTYAYDPTVDPVSDGGTNGGGPSGLIYDTKTIQVVGVETTIGNGSDDRSPIRYTLQPVGYPSSAQFYVYVDHAKAGTNSSDSNLRSTEATQVRADADALGASAHIIYTGDWNFDNGSTEAGYQTLTSTAGNGKAIDPGSFSQLYEDESAQGIKYRDELELYSAAANTPGQPGSQNGVDYVSGSFHIFGNNGSTGYGVAVNSSANTALSDLANRTTVLNDLTQVTDHLPTEEDFLISGIPLPEPSSVGLLAVSGLLLKRTRHPGRE